MIQRLIAELARLAVERRGAILLLFLLLTLGFASQLPRLKVDTSPEALVSEIAGQDEAEALFEEHFERSETQILVAIDGTYVLSQEALTYQYRVHRALADLKVVSRVEGITDVALPDRIEEPASQDAGSPEVLALHQKKVAALIDQARKDGKFPEQHTLEDIVAGDEGAYPDAEKTLTARLLEAHSAAPIQEDDWPQEDYKSYVEGIRRAPWLRPLLLSEDESATALIVHLDKYHVFDEQTRMAALDLVRKTVASIDAPASLRVHYGGSPVLGEAILDKLEQDRLTLNPAMGILCLLVLVFTFRWWPAVVAPLLAVGVACLGVMGAMALLDQPLTILTNIIPPLLLIVGLSDSVHLLGRYREEVGQTPNRSAAIRKATIAMVAACFLTSLTTAVGFGSMASAKTDELQRFGFAASFGVMLAYLATVFCVPAFIGYFKVPRGWLSHPEARAHTSRLELWIAGLALWTMRHFKWVAFLALVSTAGLSYLASQVQADARLLDAFDPDEEISQVTRTFEDKLGGIRPLEILLSSSRGELLEPEVLEKIAQVESWLQSDPEVITVASYLDPIRHLRGSLALGAVDLDTPFNSKKQVEGLIDLMALKSDGASPYLSQDKSVARMTVFFRDSGVRHTLSVVDRLERELREPLGRDHQIKWTMMGEAYTGSLGRQHVLGDLLTGLAVALLTIFALLTLLFRSLPLGLAAMPPNVIPLLATGAYMMARGIQLNLTTVITFSIGIGLAVDDTVHVVARFREESARLSSKRVALLRALRGTGTAIVITAISLSLGFGVLMLSAFVSVRQFGELIAVTVINCLFGALLIQPALLRMVSSRRRSKVIVVRTQTQTVP